MVKGRIYTFGITGVLSCYETENGKQVWQADAFKPLKVDLPRFGATCSPLVVGNRVLVAVGGKGSAVVAFDADNGEMSWKALDGPISTASPIVYLNKSKKAEASLEAVFINNRSLVALNPFNGEVSWEQPLSDQALGTSPSPVVAGDLLLASSADHGGVGVQLTHADGKTTAAEAWKNADLTGYFSTPLACGKDHIYMVTTKSKPQPTATLRCIEVKTGKELWNQPKVGFFHAGLLRTGDDKLLLLDDSGRLRLLEHDPKGYHELAKAEGLRLDFRDPGAGQRPALRPGQQGRFLPPARRVARRDFPHAIARLRAQFGPDQRRRPLGGNLMRMKCLRFLIVLAVFLTATPFGAFGPTTGADKPMPPKKAEDKKETGALTAVNEKGKATATSVEAFGKLPRQTVKTNDPAGTPASYEGVSLAEVLRAAGVTLGKDLKGPLLASCLVVQAADGYRVVFSLPEIDPDIRITWCSWPTGRMANR